MTIIGNPNRPHLEIPRLSTEGLRLAAVDDGAFICVDLDTEAERALLDVLTDRAAHRLAAELRRKAAERRTAAIDPGVDRGPVVGEDPATRLGREVEGIYERAGEVLAAQTKGNGNG